MEEEEEEEEHYKITRYLHVSEKKDVYWCDESFLHLELESFLLS